MHILLLLESIFVGFYILSIFMILHLVTNVSMLMLFIVGFLKHFLGYFLRLHEFYCNYKSNKKSSKNFLVIDSILEGVVVMCVVTLFATVIDIHLAVFITGVLLHLFSEVFGIHYFFLLNRCQKN